MDRVSTDDGHFVTYRDQTTGDLYSFAVGRTTGFYFIGGTADNPSKVPPTETSPGFVAAEADAREHFRQLGLL